MAAEVTSLPSTVMGECSTKLTPIIPPKSVHIASPHVWSAGFARRSNDESSTASVPRSVALAAARKVAGARLSVRRNASDESRSTLAQFAYNRFDSDSIPAAYRKNRFASGGSRRRSMRQAAISSVESTMGGESSRWCSSTAYTSVLTNGGACTRAAQISTSAHEKRPELCSVSSLRRVLVVLRWWKRRL